LLCEWAFGILRILSALIIRPLNAIATRFADEFFPLRPDRSALSEDGSATPLAQQRAGRQQFARLPSTLPGPASADEVRRGSDVETATRRG